MKSKVAGFFALPFLAMALSAFANAQDGIINQPAVTPQEFQGAKAQLEQQAQRLDGVQHDIDRLRSDVRGNTIAVKKQMEGMVTTQTQQGAAIKSNATALQRQSESTEKAQKGLQAQITALVVRTKGQSIVLTAVCISGLLIAIGVVFFVRRTMSRHDRHVTEAMEEQQEKINKELEQTRKLVEEQRQLMEIEFPNPSVEVMASVCAKLREKNPKNNTVLITTVLNPSPKNGLPHSITIKGIKAVFRPGPLEGQKPAMYLPGSTNPIPVSELKKNAERFAYDHGLVVTDELATEKVVSMLNKINQRAATQS